MLWTALNLPQLPLDCYAQTTQSRPFAIVEKRRIHMANTAAHAQGVKDQMALSAALALAPMLQWRERDLREEKVALEDLSLWALQFTSHVSLAAPHGLLLETGGSARLFGGQESLLQKISAAIAAQGYHAVLASAPTPSGALMLARAGYAEHIATLPELRRVLPSLPATSLSSAQAYAATFESLGARNVADLMALPRDGLKRRFGDFLLEEIDRAFGHAPDPLRQVVPPALFKCSLPLPAPVESSEALVYASGRGLRQLEGFLRAGKRAVDRIELTLHHERHARRDTQDDTVLTLHLMQPSADAKRFTLLLAERLNRHTLARRVERITLTVPQLLRAEEITPTLLFEEEDAARDMRDLLERLHARLGPQAVQQLQVHADHRPARASGSVALLEAGDRAGSHDKKPKEPLPAPAFGPRPVWLLDPPRPLNQCAPTPFYEGPLKLLSSVERIEAGWWDEEPMDREYFIAQNTGGALLWVFREYPRQSEPARIDLKKLDLKQLHSKQPEPKQPDPSQANWFLQGYFA
jgi:protein ImuB